MKNFFVVSPTFLGIEKEVTGVEFHKIVNAIFEKMDDECNLLKNQSWQKLIKELGLSRSSLQRITMMIRRTWGFLNEKDAVVNKKKKYLEMKCSRATYANSINLGINAMLEDGIDTWDKVWGLLEEKIPDELKSSKNTDTLISDINKFMSGIVESMEGIIKIKDAEIKRLGEENEFLQKTIGELKGELTTLKIKKVFKK